MPGRQASVSRGWGKLLPKPGVGVQYNMGASLEAPQNASKCCHPDCKDPEEKSPCFLETSKYLVFAQDASCKKIEHLMITKIPSELPW